MTIISVIYRHMVNISATEIRILPNAANEEARLLMLPMRLKYQYLSNYSDYNTEARGDDLQILIPNLGVVISTT